MLAWLACVVAIVGAAHGHDAPSGWHYDRACCGNADCAPVPCEDISAVAGGFEYRDRAARATYFFTRDKQKVSQDENCHVCISTSVHSATGTGAPLCVYLPVRM